MSELDRLLETLAGDDEWGRHRTLERLREEGLPADRLPRLVAALDDDADATRRSAARMALAALAAPESPLHDRASAALAEALRSEDPDLRILAASALGESGDQEAAAALVRALDDPDHNVAAAAADGLGRLAAAEAVEPLAEHVTAGPFWVRAAAVVALGLIRDARALPALKEAAAMAALERPVIEAVRSIGEPEGLDVLESTYPRAPEPALLAAGSILCAHPDVRAGDWIHEGARAHETALLERFAERDEPSAARLLGLAGTDAARDALMKAAGPPRRSEAAIAGILALPRDVRRAAILRRLPEADAEERVALLALLPPLEDTEAIRRLVPLLSDEDAGVRAAVAEALGRAPAEQVLPLLEPELRREHAPDVVRALGGLGGTACRALLPLLHDHDEAVRTAAAEALTRCATEDVAGPLRDALDAASTGASREALLRALGRAGGEAAVDRLAEALEDDDLEVRLAALEGLGATGTAAALPPLRRALQTAGAERMAALQAIADLAVPEATPELERLLRDPDLELRRQAARGAMAVASHLSDEAVAAMSGDRDPWVRLCAVRVAGRRPAGRQTLERMARGDQDTDVRAEAQRLLERGGR